MTLDFSSMTDAELDAFIAGGGPAPSTAKQNTGIAGDFITGLKQGAARTISAIPDLVSIPFALAGVPREYLPSTGFEEMGKVTGFQPGKYADSLSAEKSQALQAAQQNINRAWDEGGFWNIAGEYAANPRVIPDLIAQSLPAMVGGGVLGRGARSLGLTPTVATGVGEGAITAGMMMNEMDSVDPQRAAMFSLLGGAGTGVLGGMSASVAKRMGLPDIEAAIVSGAGKVDPRQALQYALTAPQAVGVSMLREGLFEEFPQSLQEQIMQNLAEGKPWQDGVVRAGVEGMLAGAPMGGLMGGYSHMRNVGERNTIANDLRELGYLPATGGLPPPTDLLGAYDKMGADASAIGAQMYDERQAATPTAIPTSWDIPGTEQRPTGNAAQQQAMYEELFGIPTGAGEAVNLIRDDAGDLVVAPSPISAVTRADLLTGETAPVSAATGIQYPFRNEMDQYIEALKTQSAGELLTPYQSFLLRFPPTQMQSKPQIAMPWDVAEPNPQATVQIPGQVTPNPMAAIEMPGQVAANPEAQLFVPQTITPTAPLPELGAPGTEIQPTQQPVAAEAPAQGAVPNAPQAAQAVQSQSKEAPQAAADDTDDVTDAEIAAAITEANLEGQQNVAVTSAPGEVAGRVTMDQQVLRAIAREIATPKEKSGAGKVMLPGTNAPDPTKADLAPKVREVAALAKNVAKAFQDFASLDSNIVPSAPTLAAKRQSVKVPETTAEQLAESKKAVKTALDAYRTAIKKQFGGTDMDAQAILAVFKNRVLKVKEKGLSKAKYDRSTDYALSRAWTMFKNGEFDMESPVVRNTPIRRSWEMSARGDVSPLETAAAEGYARRPANAPAHKGLRGVVAYIQRHGNTVERLIAAAIDNALSTAKSPPGIVFVDPDGKVKSHYNVGKNMVTLRRDQLTPEVALHEALHAALAWFVLTHKTHPSVTRLTTALSKVLHSKAATDAPAEAKQVLATLRTVMSKKGTEAAVLEFISYGLTNRDFFTWLKSHEAVGGSDSQSREYNAALQKGNAVAGKGWDMVRDLWNAFRRLIARLVTGKENVAGEVFDQTMRLLEGAMYAKGPDAPVKSRKVLDITASPAYNRVAMLWKTLNEGTAGRLFRVGKMDDSYGTPKRAFTMGQIFAKHKTEGWDQIRVNDDTLAIMNERRKYPEQIVKAWRFATPGDGTVIIAEYADGVVTADTFDLKSGQSEGWRGLQMALAYAFYNGKTFVGEVPQQTISDVAVHRYIEAMMSAAIKYGSTDFINPSRRFLEPQDRIEGEPKTDALPPRTGYGLKGWQTEGADRFINNLGLLTRSAMGITQYRNKKVIGATFDPGQGFVDAKGKKLKNLTTTEMRAIIGRFFRDSAIAEGTVALQAADTLPGLGLEGILYHDLNTAVKDPAINFRMHAQKQALLKQTFENFGYDPKRLMAKIKTGGGRIYKMVADFSPAFAGFMSLFNAAINLTADLAKIIDESKADRKVPVALANQFISDISKLETTDDVMAAFAYLDTGKGKVPAHIEKSADDLRAAYETLRDSISDKATRDYLADLPLSQALAFVVDASHTASSSFGAHRLELLQGSLVDKEAIFDEAWLVPEKYDIKGLTGKFYRYSRGNDTGFAYVHESMLNDPKLTPQMRKELEQSPVFKPASVSTKLTDAPRVMMRGTPTLRSKLDDNGALSEKGMEEATAALLNTISVLSNAVASADLAAQVANSKTDVFDDAADLAAAYDENTGSVEKLYRMDAVRFMDWGESHERSQKLLKAYRSPHAWIKLPNTDAYGPLKGKIVRGSVWMAIQDSYNRGNLIDSETYMLLLRGFKKVKTVYNLPTHTTNVLTNMSLAHMHNISIDTLARAAKLYRSRLITPENMSEQDLRVMAAFHKSGAELGDYSSNEIKGVLYDSIVSSLHDHMQTGKTKAKEGIGNQLAGLALMQNEKVIKAKEFARKKGLTPTQFDEMMTRLYASEDNVFRLAAFLTKMGDLQKANDLKTVKDSEDNLYREAGYFARKAFLDYDIDSRAVNLARQTFLPFISWTYAIIPVLSRIAVEQPWKLVTLGAAYAAVTTLLSAAAGDEDDDQMRKRLGMDERMFGFFGPYTNVRLPIDAQGEKTFVPLGKFIPVPFVFKEQPNGAFGNKYWPSNLTPNGPLMAFVAAVVNVDPYTGKALSSDADSNFERMMKAMQHIWQQMTPGGALGALIPGTKPTFMPDKGISGSDPNYLANALKLMGVPVKTVNETDAAIGNAAEVKSIAGTYRKARYEAEKKLRRGSIDSEKYAEMIREYTDREMKETRDALGVK